MNMSHIMLIEKTNAFFGHILASFRNFYLFKQKQK